MATVTTERLSFGEAMCHVREMTELDVPFELVEMYVESCGELDEEERALLWLYGWCGGEAAFLTEQLGR